MRIYINTKTKITPTRILEKCTATTNVEVSLANLLKFDMIDTLLDTPSQLLLNSSSLHTDVVNGDVEHVNIQVQAATPLTFVLRIDPRALAASGYSGYEIKVLTILTMYFVSNIKKDSMLNLLRSGTAFSYYKDGSIKPGEDLLRICPLHRTVGVYGCMARFEVQSGLYDVDTTPILAIPPDPHMCTLAASAWAYRQRTASLSFAHLMGLHAEIVRENFAINPGTRKAFVIAQDIPWREDEFSHDHSLGGLRYSQVGPVYTTSPTPASIRLPSASLAIEALCEGR